MWNKDLYKIVITAAMDKEEKGRDGLPRRKYKFIIANLPKENKPLTRLIRSKELNDYERLDRTALIPRPFPQKTGEGVPSDLNGSSPLPHVLGEGRREARQGG